MGLYEEFCSASPHCWDMGTRILRIVRMKADFLVAWRPLILISYGFDPPSAGGVSDYDFYMIDMMAMIT